MQSSDYRSAKRIELLAVANAILYEQINLLDGVRKINVLRYEIGDAENEVFLPIQGIDSETDNFPLGAARRNWAADSLEKVDAEMESYLLEVKKNIFQSCLEIVQVFS